MNTSRRAVEWIIAAWVLCLALALPLAASANGAAAVVASQQTTQQVLDGLMAGKDPALSLSEPSTSSTGWLTGTPFYVPAGALVVNSPGTDDTTLYKRIDPMRGDLETVIVVYPQSMFPIISGNSGQWLPIFAPTYDQSVALAVAHNLATMEGLQDASDKPYLVYSGYSQGADALGNAAEQAYAQGLLDPASTQVVLLSDPRSPWGVKQWASDHFLVGIMACLIGITPNGARNPADTGDELQVTSVIIDGDPVANFQWVWYRPITSLIVDAAGGLAIHGLMGPQNYSNLDEIQDKDVLYSRDGRTTYIVYHAEHPLTQLTEMAWALLGIRLSDDQVTQLDDFNNWFYPLQQPSPERAAPAAPVTTTPSTPARIEEATPATPALTVAAVPKDVNVLSSRSAAPEIAAPTSALIDDEPSTTPAVAEDIDTVTAESPVAPPPAETTDTTSPQEATGSSADEDVTPDPDLPKTSTSQQESDDSVTSEMHSGPAQAGDSASETTDVKQDGDHVEQPAQETSASQTDKAAA